MGFGLNGQEPTLNDSLQSCQILSPTVGHSLPVSSVMELSRQEHWSRLLRPPPEDLPNGGLEPVSSASSVLAGRLFTTSAIWEVCC